LLLDPRHRLEIFNLTNLGKELLYQLLEKFKEIYKKITINFNRGAEPRQISMSIQSL